MDTTDHIGIDDRDSRFFRATLVYASRVSPVFYNKTICEICISDGCDHLFDYLLLALVRTNVASLEM